MAINKRRLLSNTAIFAVGFVVMQRAVKWAGDDTAPPERAGRMGIGISPITGQE
ncbi:hypothetical protein [Nocardia miyunensis]|uniref:hypothetical protein n=1 Tax=Nocardia miyunensis TaxID=282684 RepID=UPI000B02E6E2|nr:hypothetical protein [Nocardia miyunensis]